MITLFLGPICFTGLQVLSDVGVTIVIMLVSIRLVLIVCIMKLPDLIQRFVRTRCGIK